MGFRLQRSIKVLPGVRLNLSKSGVGISAGVRGLRVGRDAAGHTYTSVGIPGTGISSRHYFRQSPSEASARRTASRPDNSIGTFGIAVLIGIAAAAIGLASLLLK